MPPLPRTRGPEFPAQSVPTTAPATPPNRHELRLLPRAHLHLHFTGAMRPQTLVDMALEQETRLPTRLLDVDPLKVPADGRGWFRFQRSYDAARHLVHPEESMRRIAREAVEDEAAGSSVRLEIQANPTSYAPWVRGITLALEVILDEVKLASARIRVEVVVIVAASGMWRPLDAKTLVRLATRYAGDGPGEVVGFGLSNDERMGQTSAFSAAFGITRRAGLAALPHGGELLDPESVREVATSLNPRRLGHGVRTGEDLELLDRLIEAGIAFEVCPTSNVHLGVYQDFSSVPLPLLMGRGATIALGAGDPPLFHPRLLEQYANARKVLALSGCQLADLARQSVAVPLALQSSKRRWYARIKEWVSGEAPGADFNV